MRRRRLLGGLAQPVDGEAEQEVIRMGFGPVTAVLSVTLAKFAAFVALMLIVGRKLIPWILHYVAHTGSRELFRLAVLSIGTLAVLFLVGRPGRCDAHARDTQNFGDGELWKARQYFRTYFPVIFAHSRFHTLL